MSIKQRTKFYSKLCFSLCVFHPIQMQACGGFPGGEDKINQGEKQKKTPTSFSNTNKNHIQWMTQKSIFSTKANTNSSCAHFHGFLCRVQYRCSPPPLPKCSLSLHREVKFWATEESKCARPWTCSWHLSVLLQPVEIRQTLILRQLPHHQLGGQRGWGGGWGGCGSKLRSKSHLETGGNFRQNRREDEVVNKGGLCSGICLDWFSSLQCKNWV